MNERIIKEINTQLEGVHMGISTLRRLKKRVSSEKLKEELESILDTLKQHKNILTIEIQSNYYKATKNEGVWGKIIEFFSEISNLTTDSDRKIANSAYKGVEMAFTATNEFLMDMQGLKATFRDELSRVSDNYVKHIKSLEKIVESLRD